MPAEAVNFSDIDPADEPGPDELALNSDADEGLDLEDGEDSSDPETGGPDEGELPAEDPSDEDEGLADEQPEDDDEDGEANAPDQSARQEAPPPPEGFASWDEVKKLAQAAPELQRWAEYGRRMAAYQASAQRQQPAQQETPPRLISPLAADQQVADAYRMVQAATDPSAALKGLSPGLAEKVVALDSQVRSAWSRYQLDPVAFVADHVAPALERSPFAQRLLALEQYVAHVEGQNFLREHAAVLQTQEDRVKLEALLRDGVPKNYALRMIELEKRQQTTAAKAAKVDERQRSQQATKAKARANQAAKRGAGRAGAPASKAPRTTDFMALFNHAKNQANGLA